MNLDQDPAVELKTSLSPSFFKRFCPDPTVMYELGDLYAELNARFFRGELPILPSAEVVDANGETRNRYGTLKWDGRMRGKTLGRYTPNARRGHGTIRLSRGISGNPVRTRSVLLHEMLHKYLDLKGLDGGIKGHGENFISHAKEINETCQALGVDYRIHFYDVEITQQEPIVVASLLNGDIPLGKDLDVARKMMTVARAAFDLKFSYHQ